MKRRTKVYLFLKRFIDFTFSLLSLALLFPLFFFISILIKLDSKGPILFKQKRVGQYNKHFHILKFRTMRIDTPKDTPTHLLKDPLRYITKVGKFLRKTSLDELPQIINILKGDMSIIGPRPALWNQEDLIIERNKHQIFNILPGLTGYAQINGRDNLSIYRKASLDHFYYKNISLSLDLKIFFLTFFKVLSSQNIKEGDS
jgi:O-antigen biosynthesis protein WbqP